MEIHKTLNGLDTYQAKLEKAEAEAKIKREKTAKGGDSGESDTVSLSAEAKLRTEAHRTAANTQDIRPEKVAEIKAKIANGTYEIDSRKIAEKLVKEDLELLF